MIGLYTLFIMGLVNGAGPCLVVCMPILVPYIIASASNWRDGLFITLTFAFVRALTYAIMGFFLGAAMGLLNSPFYMNVISFAGGMVLIGLGALQMFGKKLRACKVIPRSITSKHTAYVSILLGIIIGLSPCPPLLGAFVYISMLHFSAVKSALLALSFGLGTAISPLILFGVAAGTTREKLDAISKKTGLYAARISGVILIVIGLIYTIRFLF